MSVGNGNASGSQGAGRRPFGEVIASVVEGFRTLGRQRVELAKAEVAEAAGVRAAGVGMFAGAAAVAFYAIGFLAAAGAAALAIVLPVWAAILIVGALLVLIGAILVVIGRRTIQRAPTPGERTREALREDAAWVKRQIAR